MVTCDTLLGPILGTGRSLALLRYTKSIYLPKFNYPGRPGVATDLLPLFIT